MRLYHVIWTTRGNGDNEGYDVSNSTTIEGKNNAIKYALTLTHNSRIFEQTENAPYRNKLVYEVHLPNTTVVVLP